MNNVSDMMPDRPYKKNSFAAKHPDLMEEYDPSNTIDPFQAVCSSREKVLWSHMDNPKHTWWASFEQRHKGEGKCPYCDDRELLPGFNSLRVRFPDTAKNWSPKNKKSADHYLPQSKEKVIWDCPDCHGEYVASVCSVFLQTYNCPYCYDRKALPGFNTIAARHPDHAKHWSPNNTLDADMVLAESKQPGEWICPDCGNTYFAAPFDVVAGNADCPYCNEKYAVPGYEFLSLVYPELAESLIGLTNNNYNGEAIQDSEMCDWRCPECQAVFSAYMKDAMLDAKAGRKTCPFCKGRALLSGINSLDIKHPDVVKLWSLRNEKKAAEVLPESKEVALWICPKCYNEYEATIVSMTSGEMECPYCTDWQALPGVDQFALKHYDIVKLWSSKNGKFPSEVLPQSTTEYIWSCPECHGEFRATIIDMMTETASCPYCNDRRVLPGYNSLAVKQPEIAKMWSSKNAKSADEVLYKAYETALWACNECHGEFRARIREMITGEVECPYCNDRKVLAGFNSFAAKHKDLLTEWDYVSNYILADPDQILDSCVLPVWWTCSENPEHEYTMPPAKRILFQKRRKKSCPYCKGRRRKKRHFI